MTLTYPPPHKPPEKIAVGEANVLNVSHAIVAAELFIRGTTGFSTCYCREFNMHLDFVQYTLCCRVTDPSLYQIRGPWP